MSQQHIDRLIEIAQRLDELAEDLPELEALSEDLGRLAEAWPMPQIQPPARTENPRWLDDIREMMERAAMEIVAERYRGNSANSANPYITIQIPNHQAMIDAAAKFPSFVNI